MNRRNLFQSLIGMRSLASATVPHFDTAAQPTPAGWRVFDVSMRVEIRSPAGLTRVWLPRPLPLDTPFQRTLSFTVDCPWGKTQMQAAGNPGGALTMVEAVFAGGDRPSVSTRARVATRDWAIDLGAPGQHREASHDELQTFLQPTRSIPTDGLVRERALEITRGANSDLQKARAIYAWVVDHSYRRSAARGCGVGDIRPMVETGDLGGKCADISALFVGLARASGLPARDVYGIRVAPSQLGYTSLGPATEDITKAQHCRAEVYLREFGWVPVDPADVRKVMLEEPPGNLDPGEARVQALRARLFGSWEMNWIAFNYGQDVVLPGSAGAPLPFLMYPQAETADGRLDSLDPDSFRYTITAREARPAKA